jgi:hypothetical protein
MEIAAFSFPAWNDGVTVQTERVTISLNLCLSLIFCHPLSPWDRRAFRIPL